MAQLAEASFAAETSAQEIFAGTGLVQGTPVLTLDGELPVEFLMPGDRVITRNGMRKVLQVEVTRVENARVVAISPDSLGVGRPDAVIFVAPAQAVLIRDWRAKALYGRTEAQVAAASLCDGEFIRADILPEARFVALRFAGPEVIFAGGTELACAAVPVAA
ncbi:Hint domain-containing protein [Tabrizicola oligotrophica]|uniref:Hedgehog/Intein (Hint) domain-containing protein n=1 Tax=Tabrizicola oligotrophica TaxID=2710650 RepID=A0A6M0QN23_9RHOB|nr:Hint domain-containing protein [Tabrizicola oligotrophica]NEY88795.1 hypothetical protein [Tabrizicola oligotrophica]